MLTIPQDVLAKFIDILKQRKVPERIHADYRKWLRYLLDFRSKYQPPDSRSDQVRLFIEKLQQKNQTPAQQKQAAYAVSLFFEMQNAGKATTPSAPFTKGEYSDTTTPSAPRNHNSLLKAPTVGQPPLTLRGGGKAGGVTINEEYPRSSQYVAIPKAFGRLPLQVSEAETTPSPSPSPARGEGNSMRSHYNEWRCLEKSDSPHWDKAVDNLAAEIKMRHYSRKTLKTYADWSRKFQVYLKNKPPEELSAADVKDYLTYLAVNCKVSASTQNQAFLPAMSS